jgi:hypothetical protein
LTARASKALRRAGSIDAAGYDAGKKIKGKKRHLLVDTQGLLMCAIVHAADIQDRDGGVTLAQERTCRPSTSKMTFLLPVKWRRVSRLGG